MIHRKLSLIFSTCVSIGMLFTILSLLPSTLHANHPNRVLLVPEEYQTIQEAVNAATNGDTILISSGTYTENIFIWAKVLSIYGTDVNTTIIDGGSVSQVFLMQNNAEVTIENLTIRNGYGTNGGGIRTEEGKLTVNNVLLTGNSTFDNEINLGAGAAIFALDTDLIISNSQLIANNSSAVGGGVYFQANMRPSAFAIHHSQILSNSAEIASGGIQLFTNSTAPSPLISHSTIAYNTSSSGAGITIWGSGDPSPAPANIVNSTISHNQSSSYGGGLLVYTASILEHTTIIDNQPSGIHLASGDLILGKTIIFNSGDDCVTLGTFSLESHGSNISSDSSCQLDHDTDLPNVNPSVGLLQNNGGSSWTHALSSNSPALNSATNCLTDDQRGRPRSAFSCDIGAYEAQPYAQDDLVIVQAPILSVTVDVLANDLPGLAGIANLEFVSHPVHGIAQISEQQIVYTPTTGFVGTDSVMYQISDDVITSSARLTITITDAPIVNLVVENSSPTTLNDFTVFTATVEAGTNVTYSWDFGDDSSGSGHNPVHLYTDAGEYVVTVTATNGVSQDVQTTIVQVLRPDYRIYLPLMTRH